MAKVPCFANIVSYHSTRHKLKRLSSPQALSGDPLLGRERRSIMARLRQTMGLSRTLWSSLPPLWSLSIIMTSLICGL